MSYSNGDGTKVMTVNWGPNSLDLTLHNGDVTATGFDLGGTSSGGTYVVNVYSGAHLLGSTTLDPANGTFGFVGMSSPDTITRANVASSVYETVDNIAFGGGSGPVPGVPEPGLATYAAGSLLAGAFWLRRRRA